MSKYWLRTLCLGLAIVGFAVGMGGVVSYFRGEANSWIYMVIGWVFQLAGGLYLLKEALKEEREKKG